MWSTPVFADWRSGSAGRVAAAAAVAVLLLLFAVAPMALSGYWLRVLSMVFMLAVVAQGINLMAGYTGYPAFGNVVFFGIGAYATAMLMVNLQWSFSAAAALAILGCITLALLLGPPLLRLKGHYFAIATLGLNEACKELVANAGSWTGGGVGMSLPIPPGGPAANAMRFYYLFLGLLLIATVTTWWFGRSRLGLGCQAIRDNEEKALCSGLQTTHYKTAAWMLSAALTAAAGAIQAWWLTYIDPPTMFDMALAVKAFAILLLGGAGTVMGPVFGAFFVELVANLTWSRLLNWHLGATGLIIMLVVLWFPDGFLGTGLRPKAWLGRLVGRWVTRRGVPSK